MNQTFAQAGAGSDADDNAIQLHDVHKSYHQGRVRVQALAGINLRVQSGEFTAIMGASGSGKSTLLHLLALLDKPDRGDIWVLGRNIERLTEREATLYRRRGVGVVFQQFNLIPTLTAMENILLPARLAGSCDAAIQTWAAEIADALHLGSRLGYRPDALSGGEQQRTAIARALIMRPTLLLADEPTGNLDSASTNQFWKLLQEMLARVRTTVLVVTHELSTALKARRVVVLRDGRIAGDFCVTPEDDMATLAARYQELAG